MPCPQDDTRADGFVQAMRRDIVVHSGEFIEVLARALVPGIEAAEILRQSAEDDRQVVHQGPGPQQTLYLGRQASLQAER